MADAELAGESVDEVQAGSHHDVDACKQHDLHIIAVDNIRTAKDHDQRIKCDHAEQGTEFSTEFFQEQRRGVGRCFFHDIRPP